VKRIESAAATRRALLDQAAALLDRGGPDAVTLREVGARAGVSRGAPYRHFCDKQSLLTAIAAESWERLADHMRELQEDPHDFFAMHVLHYGQQLAGGHNTFAILFLLTHGLVKIVLVVALLRNLSWSYLFALITLGLFIVYQLYELVTKPTFGMAFLTVLDSVIIWLVWREWGKYKLQHLHAPYTEKPEE